MLWAVPGWRPLLQTASINLALTGGNVLFGVAWTTAQLWWRAYDHLTRDSQRVLVTAAARALETCQRCGAARAWREPTTRMPTPVISTVDGPVRLRLCASCRLQARDAARFLAELEAADAVAVAVAARGNL